MSALLIVLNLLIFSPEDVALCQSVQASSDSYGAHAIGCDDPYGVYLPDDGRCAAIARSYARYVPSDQVIRRVESHNCVSLEDGTYADVEN